MFILYIDELNIATTTIPGICGCPKKKWPTSSLSFKVCVMMVKESNFQLWRYRQHNNNTGLLFLLSFINEYIVF